MSLWIQITSGRGPRECQWVVSQVAIRLIEEARMNGFGLQFVDPTEGEFSDYHQSILLSIQSSSIPSWLTTWIGSIQYTGESLFRPGHRRKNWFVGVQVMSEPESDNWSLTDVHFETFRASGPGGQNVNKVASAVRVTHPASGLSVAAQDARSQLENKRLALERLKNRLMEQDEQVLRQAQKTLRDGHCELERGNPVRKYVDPDFRRIK